MDTNTAPPATPMQTWLQTRSEALIEVTVRILTVTMLGVFLYTSLVQFARDPSRVTLLLMVVSEVVTIVFSMFSRVPAKRDWNPLAVITSAGATFYFLAFDIKPGIHLIPEWVAVCLQVIGMSIQIAAKLSLRRSFGILPANRGIVVHGPYKLVRHPMYFGYLIKDFGFLLPNFGLRNVLVLIVHWTLQIGRIIREEKLLKEDETYREYVKRVRYRLIAGVF